MTSEELITKQAEEVYAVDPGVPGGMPRVWAYRVRTLQPTLAFAPLPSPNL